MYLFIKQEYSDIENELMMTKGGGRYKLGVGINRYILP